MSGRAARTSTAGAAVRRALEDAMGPLAVEGLALGQVRVAWEELMAEGRLERGPLSSRVMRITGSTAHVEASDPILAQELNLRREALVWTLNARMKGRPGATIVVRELAVSVGRGGTERSL